MDAPDELWIIIFQFLYIDVRLRFSSINKHFYQLVSDSVLELDDRWDMDNDVSSHELKRFTNLVSLDLRRNDVIIGPHIRGMTRLTTLYLGRNEIIDTPSLLSLTNITKLDLRNNMRFGDNVLRALSKIVWLDISRSCLNTTELITNRGISILTNLTFLDISGGGGNIYDSGIVLLTNLTTLQLNGRCNKITDNAIKHLTNLTELGLYNNNAISGNSFHSLTKLKKLCLVYSNVDMSNVCIVTGLESLDITSCPQAEDIHIREMIGLKKLIIRGETFVTCNSLTALTNLKILDIMGNVDFGGSEIALLARALPGTTIKSSIAVVENNCTIS
jgi:Leucine-rich repeat (LRR) protein